MLFEFGEDGRQGIAVLAPRQPEGAAFRLALGFHRLAGLGDRPFARPLKRGGGGGAVKAGVEFGRVKHRVFRSARDRFGWANVTGLASVQIWTLFILI